MFIDQAKNPEDVIAAIGRFAVKARKEGIMKLEDDVEQADDPFLQRGLSLAVDGATPTTIRTMLEGESMSRYDAEEAPARVFESAGGYAPTVGILGAVLGLINVMENLSRSDQARIGHRRRVRRDGLRRRLRQPDLPPDRDQAADDRARVKHGAAK